MTNSRCGRGSRHPRACTCPPDRVTRTFQQDQWSKYGYQIHAVFLKTKSIPISIANCPHNR
ncbi:hypothetical protein IF1G_04696 [Cordyceps javanica]|uniref:Uncharacterized protein n=1 Tax=Cordyceps javanica TaxID=43265 RepID=A0A545V335_9HYPO|nr:hypothetical protein IF1G_04696 [Cordyceps javanica]